ncbi:MAG: hypothetical protein RRY95_04560 [Oscillospiraceae bacterium]
MTLWEYYLQFIGEICEGIRPPPAGITLEGSTETDRALSLREQVTDIPAFVRACADEAGLTIPQEVYAAFHLEDALVAMAGLCAETEEVPPNFPDEAMGREPPLHPFDIFMNSILLDEGLVAYLIDILQRQDWLAFFKLSQVAAHADIDPQDFLYWVGHLEQYGEEEERACAVLMDACFARLLEEDKRELIAALLSGDQTTFELFRCEAPELQQVPAATYDWYCQYYLSGVYPLRVLMRCGGITFPEKTERISES